jgi:SAM-dependent methyltransferase
MSVPLATRVRRLVRRMVQLHGSQQAKRRLWNQEFAGGRWDCLERTPGDCVYPFIEKYAGGGAILDLGCGSGSTASELDPACYGSYTGIDISDEAIEKARTRNERNVRLQKQTFQQGDLERYRPTRQYDVILFRDSIYYVRIGTALRRYADYLTPTGTFIVRLTEGDQRYGKVIGQIADSFDVLERCSFREPSAVVLVFRPRTSSLP